MFFPEVKHVLVDDPIPGVPRMPGETDPKLAQSMVMQDGTWFLPDRVMAEFTGEMPNKVNERTDPNGLKTFQANRSQVIEIACDIDSLSMRKGGKDNKLYSRESALALLNITTNFTPDWTREKAIKTVTEAFDWVEANGDTNPGRILDRRLVRELIKKPRRPVCAGPRSISVRRSGRGESFFPSPPGSLPTTILCR